MNTKTSFLSILRLRRSTARALARIIALGLAVMMVASPAQAAFHLWSIREIYSNSSGTLQYIEFFTSSSSQNFVGNQPIVSRNVGNTLQNTFNVLSDLVGNTANRAFLAATAGFQAAAGFAPDYVIPNNFLFTAGGTITFFNLPSVTYGALPADGISARLFPGGAVGASSPQNFAGQTVTPVPEPSTWGMLALSGAGLFVLLRRRLA